ncbi:MAG: hydrogenase formation protein HypD [Chloroflexi bacterium]|nr:hydrogenase formation protein HypD [Chloroflexota bacterium]MCL5075447.1 hydrogenase formation protein HypD [Chloroflexota bacterium]
MRYLDEFQDRTLAQKIVTKIVQMTDRPLCFMEVCGTHTVAIFRSGIRHLLPEMLTLLSGPGCPVCVTSQKDIDKAIALATEPGVILVTYGDMLKVPGTRSSLQQERARGADIRVVYSVSDALQIAADNPAKMIVFLGVGFETTVPNAALSVLEAQKRKIKNYLVLSIHKLIGPPLRALLEAGEVQLNGFILPGHVSTIIGARPYEFIASDYNVSGVITGFEPLDILQAIYMLVQQVRDGSSKIEIQYRRAVSWEGNRVAQMVIDEVFEPADATWRGLGVIPQSGLRLREKFAAFDADHVFAVETDFSREPAGCRCGEILRGVEIPSRCSLFATVCTPEQPVGPCMVSSEGTCSTYYQYARTQV